MPIPDRLMRRRGHGGGPVFGGAGAETCGGEERRVGEVVLDDDFRMSYSYIDIFFYYI
jgi:hypothetical protein